MLISEFIPWVSQSFSPLYFFILYSPFPKSLIYLFPVFSSVIVGVTGMLFILKGQRNKKIISIIIFISLSLLMLFLFEMFTEHGRILYNYAGFYLGIFGSATVFFGLFWMLGQETLDN
jgi:hypothetical protein